MDAQWVTPRIMVGAALQASDLSLLVEDGISFICDVTQHDDDVFLLASLDHPAINCLWINTGDDGDIAAKVGLFKPIASWFLGAWLTPGARFIFHCDAGINRGPSACYMALRLLDWPSASAIAGMKAVRPQVGIAYQSSAEQALQQLGFA